MQCFENIKHLYETSDQKTDENLYFKRIIEFIIIEIPYADPTAEEIDKSISVETIPDCKKRRT